MKIPVDYRLLSLLTGIYICAMSLWMSNRPN